jgi:hypothetical protein
LPRTNRRIISGEVYEIVCRAREGLPLPPNDVINTILEGVIARTLRNDNVIVCHYLWMSNHCHILVLAKDAVMLTKLYMEIQKKLTEALKRLLGLRRLSLWQGRPAAILIADLEAAKDRVAYLYANPSTADLTNSIEQYPGINSWQVFQKSISNINASHSKLVPWIRDRTITKLESDRVCQKVERETVENFKTDNKKLHSLKVQPNAWIKRFKIKGSKKVSAINNSILNDLRRREEASLNLRLSKNKHATGSEALKREPIMKKHIPKKNDRKIFLICADKDLRINLLKEFEIFFENLKLISLKWLAGDLTVVWPPGVFRPPAWHVANALPFSWTC